ncbi:MULTISPECIES: hypothetical protein [Pasteurellaceae]|uniref:hypothetical protein n=2 Tax=Pasteurellaceae TaxID=712 RepID=UPI0027703521|nr:hypothetical protein [Pasteurella atlantica]MDP8111893.1 hypothetical protein [Pasteurella atlantica]MDP8141409.1 hypothetical protein [Pasteurella atlantica]
MCYILFSAVSTVTELDKDGDGIADTTTEMATILDDGGNDTIKTKIFTDMDDNGEQDSVVVTIQKPNGGRLTTEAGTIINNSDGTQTIKFEIDKYSDGKVIMYRTDTIDGSGNTIKSEERDYPLQADRDIYYTYDSSHKVIKSEYDKNLDGNIEHTHYLKYDGNRQIGVDVDTNGDTKSNYTESYQYNDKGELIKAFIDLGGNGSINQIHSYVYEKGERVQINYDLDANDTVDKMEFYKYNDIGKLTYMKQDIGADGSIDKLWFYDEIKVPTGSDLTNINELIINRPDISVTISDHILDQIVSNNTHKVVVSSHSTKDGLNLEGSFTKTTETESHGGQDFVKYTDEAGNALIVDPDITVDII